jgi:eukaryotic-like serine/threonine-protein kinase
VIHSPLTAGPTVLAGRYELRSHLGSGGMADVYLAQDTLLGREVAIKVFRDAATDGKFDERQRSEIRLLARLNHPGLVTIFDAGSDVLDARTPHVFLVMELVTGLSLSARLRSGPLSSAETALVGAQVAESLAYIHQAGIVHRDVKPANILLPGDEQSGTTEPWTKLTDFGIARLIEDAHLTCTGFTPGTPRYLSPEQATGTSPGPPTDVYSLGLVLLECLTGERCYPGTALESIAARLHHDPDIPSGLGYAWTALLTSMTRRALTDRPTAREASGSLRELIAAPDPTHAVPVLAASPTTQFSPVSPVPATSPFPVNATQILQDPHRRPRHRVLPAVIAVALAAAVALGLWLRAPDQPSAPAPSYPTVSGQLGTHLERLEGNVKP